MENEVGVDGILARYGFGDSNDIGGASEASADAVLEKYGFGTATTVKEDGRPLGFVERHGTEAEAATGVRPSDAYNDPTVGAIMDVANSVAPFTGTAARAIAGRRQKSLSKAMETGDASGAFGGMDDALKEWDETEGSKYDLFQRAMNGEEGIDYSSIYAKKRDEKGRLVTDANKDGVPYLDEKYAMPKDEARKAYVKELAATQIEQTAQAKDNAQRDLSNNTAPWYMGLAHGATSSLGFAGEFMVGGSIAKGVLGTAALSATKLGKVAQLVEKGAEVSTKARTALTTAELTAPTIAHAAERYENLTADDYRMDDAGNVYLAEKGDGVLRGATKAISGAAFENATEVALGKMVNKVFGATMKGVYHKVPGVKKLFDGAAAKVGDRTIDAAKKAWVSCAKTYSTVQNAVHFELMPVGEFAEEYVQGFGDDVIGLNTRASADTKGVGEFTKDFFDWDAGGKDLFFGVMGQTIALGLGAHTMRRAHDFRNSIDSRVVGTLKLHGYKNSDIAMMGTNRRLALASGLSGGKATDGMDYSIADFARFGGVKESEIEQFAKDAKVGNEFLEKHKGKSDAEIATELAKPENEAVAKAMANAAQFRSVVYNTALAFEAGVDGATEMMNHLNKTMRKYIMRLEERQGLGNSRANAGTKPEDFTSRVDWSGTTDNNGNMNWQTDDNGRQYIESAPVGGSTSGVSIFRDGDKFRVVHPQCSNQDGYLVDDLKEAYDFAASLDQFAQKKNKDREIMAEYVRFNANRLVPQQTDKKTGKKIGAPVVTANNAQDALDKFDWLADADKRELRNAVLDANNGRFFKTANGNEGGGIRLSDGTVLIFLDNLQDTNDALLTLAHEIGGHAAIAEGAKEKGLSLVDTIAEVYKGSKTKDSKAAQSEYRIRMTQGEGKDDARAVAQEEGMVYGNEYRMPTASLLQKAKTAVKLWMKQHGMDAKLTDEDYIAIAAAGLKRIEQTHTGDTGTDTVDGDDVTVTPTAQGTDFQNKYLHGKWVSDYYAQREQMERTRAAVDAAEAAQRHAEEAAKDEAKTAKAIADEDERKRFLAERDQMRKDAEHATKYGREMVQNVLEGWYGEGAQGVKERNDAILKDATNDEIRELLDAIDAEMDGETGSVIEAAERIYAGIKERNAQKQTVEDYSDMKTVTKNRNAAKKQFTEAVTLLARTIANRGSHGVSISQAKTALHDAANALRRLPQMPWKFGDTNLETAFSESGIANEKRVAHAVEVMVAASGAKVSDKAIASAVKSVIDELERFGGDHKVGQKAESERVAKIKSESAKRAAATRKKNLANMPERKQLDIALKEAEKRRLAAIRESAEIGITRFGGSVGGTATREVTDEERNKYDAAIQEADKEIDRIKGLIAEYDATTSETVDAYTEAENAFDGAAGLTADGKPVATVADLKKGDTIDFGDGTRYDVVENRGDTIVVDFSEFGDNLVIKQNNGKWEVEGYEEIQDGEGSEDGGTDRVVPESASAKSADSNAGAAGGKAGEHNTAAEASSADTEGEVKLESISASDLAAEEKARAQKREIERRQAAPLKGGVGEIGQSLMDLGGAEGEDLFNRTVAETSDEKAKAVWRRGFDKNIKSAGRYAGELRRIAHGMKTGTMKDLVAGAELMKDLVPQNAVIVPMPNHEGSPIRTMLLGYCISGLRDDVDVVPALLCEPHEGSYHDKKIGKRPNVRMMRDESVAIPDGRPVVVIDNVIASGATWEAAKEVLPDAQLVTLADAERTPSRAKKMAVPRTIVKFAADGEYTPVTDFGNSGNVGNLVKSPNGNYIRWRRWDSSSASVVEENSGRLIPRADFTKQMVDALVEIGMKRDAAKKYVRDERSIAKMVYGDPILDFDADEWYEPIKKNSDYPQGTVDFDNICRKRRLMLNVFTALQRHFPNKVLTAEMLEAMRSKMIEKGMMVACAPCFAEDRRQKMGEVAAMFIKGLANPQSVKSPLGRGVIEKFLAEHPRHKKVSLYDLLTLDGAQELRKTEAGREIYSAFEKFNNARGQGALRLFEGRTEYRGEILKWTDEHVKAVNEVGGLRFFSFSDFEAANLFDIVKIVRDCAIRGVKIQAYTKVPAFAKLIANTGIKCNRSLIAKGNGLDANGNLVWDTIEGIDPKDKDFDAANDNIGNTTIGINDEFIRAAMLDDFIDQLIPFHTGIKRSILARKNIDHWVNYRNIQRERKLVDGKWKTGKSDDFNVNFYTEVLEAFDIKNKTDFVNRFLEVCAKKGLQPRFAKFLNTDGKWTAADARKGLCDKSLVGTPKYVYTEGYHKLLVDYKMFDKRGNILPQGEVKPNFDSALMKRLVDQYSRENASLKEIPASESKEVVGVAKEVAREIGAKWRRSGVVTPEEDAAYADAVKRGDKETALRMIREAAAKAMPNTKVVGEDGLPLVVWHGGTVGNKFEEEWIGVGGESDIGMGFYFTPDMDVAERYGRQSGGENHSYLLNLENPLVLDMVDFEGEDVEPGEDIRNRGYDGVIEKYKDSFGEIVATNPSQIKSADITYDDAGNLIPLSERFNADSNDIRWRRRYTPNPIAQQLADIRALSSFRNSTDHMTEADRLRISRISNGILMETEKMMRELAQQGSISPELRDLLQKTQTGSITDRAKGNLSAMFSAQNISRIRELLQDYQISLKEMEKKYGVKMDDSAYHQFDRNFGMVANAMKELEREIIEPLGKEMREKHLDVADLNMYLLALHGAERNRMIAERSPYVLTALADQRTAPMVRGILSGTNGKKELNDADIKNIATLLGWVDNSGNLTDEAHQFTKDLMGSGATTAWWNEKLADFKKSGFDTKAAEAVKLIRKLTQMNRDLLVKTGRLSAKQAAMWEQLSPNYVPMRSDMDMDVGIWNKWLLGGGKGDSYAGKKYSNDEYNHAYGRGTIADDPMSFALQQYEESLARAWDNVARRKLADMVRTNPNMGKVFIYLSDAERNDLARRISILNNTAKSRPLTTAEMAALNKMRAKLAEANNAQGSIPTTKVLGANGIMHTVPTLSAIEGSGKNSTNIIAFKEDGELKFIRLGGFKQDAVNADPNLLSDVDAKRIAASVKKHNMAQLNGLMRNVRKLTGLFSALRTAFSPTFMVSNFGADNTQAMRNVYATFGVKAVGKFEHFAFHSFGAARSVLNGNYGTTKIQQYAKEWAENGGMIGGLATESIKDLRKGVDSTMRRLASQADQLKNIHDIKSFFTWAKDKGADLAAISEHWNSIVEMSNRIAAYATAREMGKGINEAVSYSRDITVNFNRKGTETPWINALYAFSNATMQDVQRSIVAFAEGNYAKGSGILAKRGAVMGLGLTVLGFIASMLGYWQDDDDDEKEGKAQWKYAKEYEKQNVMGIRIGGKTVGVPIRGLSRIPFYLGHEIFEAVTGRKSVANLAGDTASLAMENAIDFLGTSANVGMSLIPSIARPAAEIGMNRTFTGRQMYREALPGQEEVAVRSEMGRNDTSDAAKWVARTINSLTGGNRYKRGAVDVQPEKIAAVWNWLFGTAGRDMANITGFAVDTATGEITNRPLRNIPYLSRFMRNLDENSADYYEARDKYNVALKAFKGMAGDRDLDDETRELVKENPWLSQHGNGRRWGKELKDLEGAVQKLMKAEHAASDGEYESVHQMRLKAQYQFMRRLETPPSEDAEGVQAERDHKRAAAPLLRSSKIREKDEQRKQKKGKRLF